MILEKRLRSFLCTGATLLAMGALPVPSHGEVQISEFLASNVSGITDEDRAYSDWIELFNPDETAADLTGWYLTDNASNKTKWQFPSVSIPAGGYLVVFASNKNRREPGRELHTNFALATEGEYLALIKSDGLTVVSEFAPAYPLQSADVSYGLNFAAGQAPTPGYFRTPTPAAPNGTAVEAASLAETVQFSRTSGPFTHGFVLELTGAGPGQHIRYEAALPTANGANLAEPTVTSARYNGPLQVDRPLVIRAAVFADDLSVQGKATSAQFFQIDPSPRPGVGAFSSRLPIIVLEQHGYGGLEKEDGKQPAWFYGYQPREGSPTFSARPDIVSPIIMDVRGSSSANFSKKSYNLDLTDPQGKKAPSALFGTAAFDEWALVGPYLYDASLIRNSFMYALSNSIGRWAPKTIPVEVFLNSNGMPLDASAYVGVYALTDKIKIDRNRVDIAELRPDAESGEAITGGYLLKIDLPDANEYSWTTDHGLDVDTISSVVVTSPKLDKLTSTQRDYIRNYVQKMENALYADRDRGWKTHTYLDYLDRPSWVDFHILNTFSANPDSFERSAYMTKDRGGKLVAGPLWDFDRALGSKDGRAIWDKWYGENATQPWGFGWWGLLATDPEFMQAWIDRWQSLRKDEFADRKLTVLADNLAAAIGPEAAERDYAQWEDDVSEFGGTHAGEINHLKEWLVNRAHWIDGQFLAAPTVGGSSGAVTLIPVRGAKIAYTLDGSDPRALGGDVAPNAIVTSDPITIPISVNLQARSYNPDLKDAFPGTPWSSAVGGPNSSPLAPQSRLVNLSTRATVGADEQALITGFVVADTEGKRYLARAIGPALAAFGAAGTVPDPQLSLFSADGVERFRNNGWQTGPNATQLVQLTRSVGAFPLPPGSNDSALAVDVGGGAYTVQVSTPTGQSGVGLAELYELDANGRTANVSTRARVGEGEGALIGGFVVQGVAHKRMLIRAVGPTLEGFGVADALPDPILSIYSGSRMVATNDRWWDGDDADVVAAATTRVGAFDLGPTAEDAAMLITLAPGAYTVEVKGKAGAEGIALLEIYDLP